MIKAVIFDMDGLLIDSEPLWRQGEIRAFKNYKLIISEDDCRSTAGMRVDEVVNHWSQRNPKLNLPIKQVVNDVMAEVTRLVKQEGKAMPGVNETIELLLNANIPMAIASASNYALIHTVIEKLNIKDYFQVIMSAEHMDYGKPHPQVFIETARVLDVLPENCLVFEDSVFGVIAGKAAKMKVIAIPDKENYDKTGYCIADMKLDSLRNFNLKMLDL
jgi:sugar-phosphatase